MAISYSHDFTDISSCDLTTSGGTHYRLNGVNSGNPLAEADAYVQGTGCIANKCGGTTGTTDTGGHFNHTTTFDITNKHLFMWRLTSTPGNMLTKANAGIAIGLTNTSTTSTSAWSTTNYKKWYVDGSDTQPNSDGWKCYVLDPSSTADASAGTLTLTSVKNVGYLVRQNTGVNTALNNVFVDAIRMGTGITATTSAGGDVITMSGLFGYDSTKTNSWGVVTQNAGIYYGAGKINIGATGQTNVCNFTDSDQVLVWRDFPVADTLYEFNLKGAASFKTTMQFTTSVIRGQAGQVWNVTCDANSNFKLYGCSIANLRSGVLSSGSVLDGTSFNTCGTIDVNGATVTGCSFSGHTANQILCSSPSEVNNLTGCSFTKGAATAHAIEITGTAANFTLNCTFSGYASSNGSTGNEAVFVNIASGTVEISYTGGGSNPSIRTAGATVTFAATPVPVTVTVKDSSTGAAIPNARVLLEKVSDGTDILTGLTDSNGQITTSYSYTASTAVTGAVRRASSTYGIRYKPNVISGTITSSGFDTTVLLTSDE